MRTLRVSIPGAIREAIRLGYMLAAGLLLFELGCYNTTLWDDDAYRCGMLLERGQTEVEVGSPALVNPNSIGVAWGLSGDWEGRIRLGIFGTLDTVTLKESPHYPQFEATLMPGVSLNVKKGLLKNDKAQVVFMAGLTGCTSSVGFAATSLYWGWLNGGVGMCYYPKSWLGLSLPVKVGGVVTNQGDVIFTANPGLAVSLESGPWVVRVGAWFLHGVYAYERSAPSYRFIPFPYFSFGSQIGYRWPAEWMAH
jgi:hypothetical protein